MRGEPVEIEHAVTDSEGTAATADTSHTHAVPVEEIQGLRGSSVAPLLGTAALPPP